MKAHEIIQDKKNWIKFYEALDENNEMVDPRDNSACKFCALGAIYKAYPNDESERIKICNQIKDKVGDFVANWNDSLFRTHKQVYSLLKELDI